MHAQNVDLEDGGRAGRFVHLLLGTKGCCATPPQFLILKVHVSLWLKEEQPNVEAWLRNAAWGSYCQGPEASSTCSTLTPAQMRFYWRKSLHHHGLSSVPTPGFRLQMGYQHCLFSFWLALLQCKYWAFSSLLHPALHPSSAADPAACLVGKIEANRWELPPLAATKCTHLPTSTSATGLSFFSYTGASVPTPFKGKPLSL